MIRLRAAIPEDSSLLTSLAGASKKHWGYPDEWIRAWKDELTLSADYIADNLVVVAERDGVAVGVYALEAGETGLELGHFWILPEAMGQGIGRVLLGDALDRGGSLGYDRLRIVSDPNASSFYVRMGASTVGVETSIVCGVKRDLPLMEITT